MAKSVFTQLDLKNNRILNLGAPSTGTDAATRDYVDAIARGLDWKNSVRVCPVGNVTLATPGATLDGVTMASGDRVLLKDQTTASQNGIYTWSGASAALVRANDADVDAVVTAGLAVTVAEGTTNADKVFVLTTNDPITLGTTGLAFSQLGGAAAPYTAGNGLTLTGQSFAVNAGTGVIADGTSTRVDTSVVVRKYAANVGDGSATSISVSHNLGTKDVTVEVYTNATPWDSIMCDVTRPDTNTVTLAFATAPASGAYRVVVHG